MIHEKKNLLRDALATTEVPVYVPFVCRSYGILREAGSDVRGGRSCVRVSKFLHAVDEKSTFTNVSASSNSRIKLGTP